MTSEDQEEGQYTFPGHEDQCDLSQVPGKLCSTAFLALFDQPGQELKNCFRPP